MSDSITVDVSDLGNVTADVIIDPAGRLAITASGLKVDEALQGIPTGGTTGQALKKTSNADYDVSWQNDETGGGGGGGEVYILIRDEKTQGTNGGVFSPTSWQTRDLTNEVSDSGNNATLSSNQITLLAGTYRCHISCPAFGVQRHKARLHNITDNAELAKGTSEYANDNTGQTRSIITGKFTLAATKVLEVQHQSQALELASGIGLGVPSSFGGIEIYTVVELFKS